MRIPLVIAAYPNRFKQGAFCLLREGNWSLKVEGDSQLVLDYSPHLEGLTDARFVIYDGMRIKGPAVCCVEMRVPGKTIFSVFADRINNGN